MDFRYIYKLAVLIFVLALFAGGWAGWCLRWYIDG